MLIVVVRVFEYTKYQVELNWKEKNVWTYKYKQELKDLQSPGISSFTD